MQVTEISLLYGVLASACIVTVTAFIWMTLPLANMPSNATTKGFATNLLADDAYKAEDQDGVHISGGTQNHTPRNLLVNW